LVGLDARDREQILQSIEVREFWIQDIADPLDPVSAGFLAGIDLILGDGDGASG